jgi:hypothetical protein
MAEQTMNNEPTKLIESWFRVHNDGEFFTGECSPYSVIPPSTADATIIWTTKRHSVEHAFVDPMVSARFGLIARYGLPTAYDIASLRGFVGQRRVLFLGDMDPDDLLVFTWLRAELEPVRVEHLGISDNFLARLNAEIPNHFTIPLSESELASLKLLEKVCPDIRELIGVQCSKRLASGYKIEIEAVVSLLGSASPLLLSQ